MASIHMLLEHTLEHRPVEQTVASSQQQQQQTIAADHAHPDPFICRLPHWHLW
jgi:hypothetical protein